MKLAIWFQIPALDLDRATRFYARVLGARFHLAENARGKHAIFAAEVNEQTRSPVGGEIVQQDGMRPTGDGVLVYFNVAHGVDNALAKVEEAGGKILKPKTSIGPDGVIALIQDTEGNRLGLHSAA